MKPSDTDVKIGLCGHCRYARVLHNSRGSTFCLCTLSFTDTHFAKYPRLPMIACDGYKRTDKPADQDSE